MVLSSFCIYIYMCVCVCVFFSGCIHLGWRTGESNGPAGVTDEGLMYIFLGWRQCHRYPSACSTHYTGAYLR
ncbi:hypothetical protein BDV27DRAFT_129081 [Aspergillus caelatus]|uniref:Uncharacterized protein n=1 Tax=Aspergillus caelatus TaxID=61420 RepID=A0A5N7A4D1_9EURO|nr:uncharacterized protein BDV27DRAFT_129081 [Aspergillus caelatus]KAE8364066.1 hypothetical protein BDV27DRAFT_129081 [Aspergillus caelatus]